MSADTGYESKLRRVEEVPGKTVQGRVYQILREAIFSGVIPPDARIRQPDIAKQLGVSVSPVREALRDLAAGGLVEVDPHRGAVVKSFQISDFDEMIEIRLALEPLRSRRLLERITEEQVARLVEIHETIVRDPSRYLELNSRFHAVLEEASHAPRISGILATLEDISFVMLSRTVQNFPHRILEGISEHARIIEAIHERDLQKLDDVTCHHNQATWALVRERMVAEYEQQHEQQHEQVAGG